MKKMLFVIIAIFMLGSMPYAIAEGYSKPSLIIKAYGERKWNHESSEPLLLQITLFDPYVNSKRQLNKKRNADFFKIGSSQFPLWKLIKIKLLDAQTKEKGIDMFPLESTTLMPKSIVLDGITSGYLLYGIKPKLLKDLKPGKYNLSATLNTESKENMWQGIVTSNNLEVNLSHEPLALPNIERKNRIYSYGCFWILDGDFERALGYSDRLLSEDKNSLDGLVLKADAAFGKKDLRAAQKAYEQAIDLWYRNKESSKKTGEPPVALINKLKAVNTRLDNQ